MRITLALTMGMLVLAGATTAQNVATRPELFELSRQVADGADAMLQQLERGEPRSGKIGKQILRALLEGGSENRDARDPIYREFHDATRDLVVAASDLDREARSLARGPRDHDRGRRGSFRSERDRARATDATERRFIRSFRTVERLSAGVDRRLTAPTARGIFTNQVLPGVRAIRAELPALSAFHAREDRGFIRRQ